MHNLFLQVKDSLPAEASDANVSEARGMFERCAIGCVDEQIARMPSITKKVREKLNLNVY